MARAFLAGHRPAVLTLTAQPDEPAVRRTPARVAESTEKHANAIFDKLGLAHATCVSRRVMAVARFLGGGP